MSLGKYYFDIVFRVPNQTRTRGYAFRQAGHTPTIILMPVRISFLYYWRGIMKKEILNDCAGSNAFLIVDFEEVYIIKEYE